MKNCLYLHFLAILHLSCDEQTLQASSLFSGGGESEKKLLESL